MLEMPRPPRAQLSRRDSQAATRKALIAAAADEFVARGLERTSIERIATRAGYTRGAFYAHFADKTAVALAVLDARLDGYTDRLARSLGVDGDPVARARAAGDDYSSVLGEDPKTQRLLLEFAVYALHHDDFRGEYVARLGALRLQVAEVFRRAADVAGINPPIPIERLTLMTFSSANGVALARLLEPDQFDDDLYGELMGLLFAGLSQISQESG